MTCTFEAGIKYELTGIVESASLKGCRLLIRSMNGFVFSAEANPLLRRFSSCIMSNAVWSKVVCSTRTLAHVIDAARGLQLAPAADSPLSLSTKRRKGIATFRILFLASAGSSLAGLRKTLTSKRKKGRPGGVTRDTLTSRQYEIQSLISILNSWLFSGRMPSII